jgi:hypothetical protein
MNDRIPRLALFFKDLAHWTSASCVGLNVAGYTTAQYLKKHGVDAQAYAVRHNVDIVNAIDKYKETHGVPLTHVVISAPWLIPHDVKNLVAHFPHVQFVILSHSNVGFLQADPHGVKLYREYAKLAKVHKNLRVGGNCTRFTQWFELAYREKCVCLPNLYPLSGKPAKVWDGKSTLNIGAFGAIRPEKNFMCAAAAAVAMHSALKVPVKLHMSTGGENCKSTTLPAIVEMTEGIEGFELIRHNWETWDKFIQLVGSMDLLIQVSYTETFNMITADGIYMGVPSVVSPVIWWAPESWKADPDDVVDIAETGLNVVGRDQHDLGQVALANHDSASLPRWLQFLGLQGPA